MYRTLPSKVLTIVFGLISLLGLQLRIFKLLNNLQTAFEMSKRKDKMSGTTSNVLFNLRNGPSLRNVEVSIIYHKEKQQILSFAKLEFFIYFSFFNRYCCGSCSSLFNGLYLFPIAVVIFLLNLPQRQNFRAFWRTKGAWM